MDRRIPNIIKPLLLQYEIKLSRCFGGKIYGIYLYNSIALGAFDESKSDIDIITVISEEFNAYEIKELKTIHRELLKKFQAARKMEIMYIPKEEIGKSHSDIKPHLYFDHGRLHGYGVHNINYATWWTLKNNGIPLYGPAVIDFGMRITEENLVETMEYNLNSYWKKKLSQRFIFLSDYWTEFSVLTLCRILFTLENKNIISKCEAAKYILDTTPGEYDKVIREALRIREGKSRQSLFASRLARQKEVKAFICHIIEFYNNKYKNPSKYIPT